MHVSYLPRAVAAGARIRSGIDVAAGAGRGRARDRRATASQGRVRRRQRRAPLHACGRSGPSWLPEGPSGTPELLLRSGLGGEQVGRNLHIHPACWVGGRYEEEVRGWEGVMQSYYVDEWEPQRILLEATFTPLAFGGAWLPGSGREHQTAMLDFGHIGSIGVHLSDRVGWPRRPGRRRVDPGHLQADRRGRAATGIRHRARG